MILEGVDRCRVVGVAVSHFRIYLWYEGAFPTSRLKDQWAADIWRQACEWTGANPDLYIPSENSEPASLIPTKDRLSP
jgi:hypothetical protein